MTSPQLRRRLGFDWLEDRTCPSTFTPTTTPVFTGTPPPTTSVTIIINGQPVVIQLPGTSTSPQGTTTSPPVATNNPPPTTPPVQNPPVVATNNPTPSTPPVQNPPVITGVDNSGGDTGDHTTGSGNLGNRNQTHRDAASLVSALFLAPDFGCGCDGFGYNNGLGWHNGIHRNRLGLNRCWWLWQNNQPQVLLQNQPRMPVNQQLFVPQPNNQFHLDPGGGGGGELSPAFAFGGTANGLTFDGQGTLADGIVLSAVRLTVDWGDGSSQDVPIDGQGQFTLHHVYSSAGRRTITITMRTRNGNVIVQTIDRQVDIGTAAPANPAANGNVEAQGDAGQARGGNVQDAGFDQTVQLTPFAMPASFNADGRTAELLFGAEGEGDTSGLGDVLDRWSIPLHGTAVNPDAWDTALLEQSGDGDHESRDPADMIWLGATAAMFVPLEPRRRSDQVPALAAV